MFTVGFEKVASIRGRAKRELRTMLANKNYWAHATNKESFSNIISSKLLPARQLAKNKTLKNIEGAKNLSPADVRRIATQGSKGYISVLEKHSPHLKNKLNILASPVDSVSVLRGSVPKASNFGPYAILGRMRQLGKRPGKIIKEEALDELKDLAGTLPKDSTHRRKAEEYIQRYSNIVKNKKSAAKLVRTDHNFRGPVKRPLEKMVRRPRGIAPVGGQNILVVPKSELNSTRMKQRDFTVIAREDMEKQFPSHVVDYHKGKNTRR